MSKQMFQRNDLVHITENLPPTMSHFRSGVDAIVIGSYADQYGGSETGLYTLYFKGTGKCSWYSESHLSLLERNRSDLLAVWEKERDKEIAEKSDLDWIFEHGKEVLASPHGASVQALADSLGLGSLWGSRGEGVTYYIRSMEVLSMAAPFLESQDKESWLSLIASNDSPAST